MRRLLLFVGALTAIACSSPKKRQVVKPPAESKPIVIEGFERQPDEVVTSFDLTQDGKPDVWNISLRDASGQDVLLRKERDLNGDGKVDTWEKYAADGTTLLRAVYDLDFDGRPDVSLFYEKDQLVKKELALGFDGVPRSWNYYENGKLVRKERDTNGDGKVDTWEYWQDAELDRIGVDLDGDGQVDSWDTRSDEPAPPPAPQK